jgi:hypothetical protein
MAVIQEYYSSRFDPGAPALVTFLGGFMESRRELNQMAFKEQLAGIDPRAAALVEAAAIKRRTDLEKLAQDAAIARDTLDAKKIKDSDDKMLKLFEITSERATALDVARQRELGEATSREQSRQYKIDAAVQDASARAETVGTTARTAVTAAESSPAQIIQSIDKTVGNMLTGVGGQGGVYSNVRDPEAREAAKARLYSEAYTQAKEAGASAAVLENIRGKFGGKDPNAYLSEKFAARSTREISAGLPYAGSDLVGTMARSLNLSRADASSLLRSEVAPSSVGAPAPAPAAGVTAPAVTAMPPTAAAPAPYGYETELAQAKAMEENARAQRLGAAGAGGRFSQREVSRSNLLYGMPYYRRGEVSLSETVPAQKVSKPAPAKAPGTTGVEEMPTYVSDRGGEMYVRMGDAPVQLVSARENTVPVMDESPAPAAPAVAVPESAAQRMLRQFEKNRIAKQMAAPPEVRPEVFDEDKIFDEGLLDLLDLVKTRTEQSFGSPSVQSMPTRK